MLMETPSLQSTVIPPFDSQRKSTGGIPLFHTAARDELIRFLRGQSSSNGVVSSPTSDETLPTTQNNSEWLARGSGISESSPLVVPSDAVQIKVLRMCDIACVFSSHQCFPGAVSACWLL